MSKETLFERVRQFRLRNPSASLADANAELWPRLSKADLLPLWNAFVENAFDRIKVVQKPGQVAALVLLSERAERKATAARLVAGTKEQLFAEFEARIWDTVLPNGVTLRDALGRDLKHASGWFAAVARHVKSSERVSKVLTTRDLFNISQRVAS